MDKEYIIQNTYKVTQTQEVSIDCDDYNFLVIYGKHINGWFIAIPNWGVCVEASDPTDVFYNTEQLGRKLGVLGQDRAPALAKAIKEHWEGLTSQ